MACLHLVSNASALAECLSIAAPDDSVLLLCASSAANEFERPLLVLKDDLPSGLSLKATVTAISYQEFVELAVNHRPIISWR